MSADLSVGLRDLQAQKPVMELRIRLARFFTRGGHEQVDAFIIGKAIRHALQIESRRDLHGRRYVPNELLLFLHPRDFMTVNRERLVLEHQLPDFVRQVLAELDMRMVGSFVFELLMDREGMLEEQGTWIRMSYNPHVQEMDPGGVRGDIDTVRFQVGAREDEATRPVGEPGEPSKATGNGSPQPPTDAAASLELGWTDNRGHAHRHTVPPGQVWTLGRKKADKPVERLVNVSQSSTISGRQAAVSFEPRQRFVTVRRYSQANPVVIRPPEGPPHLVEQGREWLGEPPFVILLSGELLVDVTWAP